MQSVAPIFFQYKARKHGQVLIDTNMPAEIDGKTSILCGLVVDTEFWQALYNPATTTPLQPRQGVTLQLRGVAEALEDTLILVDPAQKAHCEHEGEPIRHDVFKHGFAGGDFIENRGNSFALERYPHRLRKEAVPTIQFVEYGHMLLAEAGMTVQGEYVQDVYDAMRRNHIAFHRRLQAQHTVKRKGSAQAKHQDFIPMFYWTAIINGYRYNVERCLVDTVAVHGPASYKNLCANVGIQLSEKDAMHDNGYITRMHRAYNQIAKIFNTYIIEDMQAEEALRKWKNMVGNVYHLFGVGDFYRGEPRMTIGATARDLLEAVVYHGAGIAHDDKAALEEFIKLCLGPATAKSLIEHVASTLALLSKVDGGRCRSNHPDLAHLLGVLADIDIKSCYGEGLRCQIYPIGRPLITGYSADNPLHLSKTLRQFLKEHLYDTSRNQLVYGLWHARVSTLPGRRLQYPQDYLQSWVHYSVRDMRDIIWSKNVEDTEEGPEGLDVKSGTTKIFTREVRDACITSDALDWLAYACGPAQREELLDSLYVRCAMIYPESARKDTPAEVLDVLRAQDKGETTRTTYTDTGPKHTTENEGPYAWYGFKLDDLLINKLLEERGMHPKKIDAALNSLYKLLCNSTYGDLTSPYFTIANPTVGNNITMRARSMAWYAEKGLDTLQCITDGGALNLNRVTYPYQQETIPAYRFVGVHRSGNAKQEHKIQYGPLGGGDQLELAWRQDHGKNIPLLTTGTGQTLEGMAAHHWIEETAMTHVQAIFPHDGIRVLHAPSTRLVFDNDEKPTAFDYIDRKGLYSFELKQCCDEMTLHGPANYGVFQAGKMIDRAQRSYPRKKAYVTSVLQGGHLTQGTLYDDTDPASILHERLRCPTRMERQETFVRSSILLPSEWRHGETSTWAHSPLKPGDSRWKAGLLRECSLSQYTYETLEQWEAWECAGNKLRGKYGQSFEVFFLHEGRLEYQQMIETLDRLIGKGIANPLDWFDPHLNRSRDYTMRHPALDALEQTQAHLRWWQGMTDDADVMHNPADHANDAPPRAEYYDGETA